jgi:hypothetical protein
MELLSNIFGSLASGVIRLAVAVGIIAATYFLLLKPVLNTTDNAINRSFGPGGLGSLQRQINHSVDSANFSVRRQVRRSFHQSRSGGDRDTRRLVHCVQHANGNVDRMRACARRY